MVGAILRFDRSFQLYDLWVKPELKDIKDLFLLGILEGDSEKNDEQKQHIDQRRELHGSGFDGVLFSEIHALE